MRNFVRTGATVPVVAAAAVASGQPVLVGNLFGVAQGAAAVGDEVELLTLGEFLLPKLSTADLAVGTPVYFDADSSQCVEKSAGKHLIGVATVAAGAGVATVQVRLNGCATTVAA